VFREISDECLDVMLSLISREDFCACMFELNPGKGIKMIEKRNKSVDMLLHQFDAAGVTLDVFGCDVVMRDPLGLVNSEVRKRAWELNPEILVERCRRIYDALNSSCGEHEWRRRIAPFGDSFNDVQELVLEYGELSDYPGIFQEDWAKVNVLAENPFDFIDFDVLPRILRNRNVFASEFELLGSCRCFKLWRNFGLNYLSGDYEIEYAETYKASNGAVVLVCSNCDREPPPFLEMREYLPLWYLSYTTYVRVCESLEDANRICRQLR